MATLAWDGLFRMSLIVESAWDRAAQPNDLRSVPAHCWTRTQLQSWVCAPKDSSVVLEDMHSHVLQLLGLLPWVLLQSWTSRCGCPDLKPSARSLSILLALPCACLELKPQGLEIVLANKRKGSVAGFLKQSFSVSLRVFADSGKKMENSASVFTQAITLA